MPRPSAALMSDAPPWVTNGSGIPVIGMTPSTIPTFTIIWNSNMPAMAPEKARMNMSSERQPMMSTRQMSAANNASTASS